MPRARAWVSCATQVLRCHESFTSRERDSLYQSFRQREEARVSFAAARIWSIPRQRSQGRRALWS